jgi:WD40 repeat protein
MEFNLARVLASTRLTHVKQPLWMEPAQVKRSGRMPNLTAAPIALLLALASCQRPQAGEVGLPSEPSASHRLPTGARLDPAGRSLRVGNMPLAARVSPDGRYLALSLSGWREQGIEILDRARGVVVQRLPQPGAFLGLAWAADASMLYASGGSAETVYLYTWDASRQEPAFLSDSITLRADSSATTVHRYPAGLALSRDGRFLYVAENLADSIAIVDLATRRVRQRLGMSSYPYDVAVAPDDRVYVSSWGGSTISVFRASPDGLRADGGIEVGRHPSALCLSADGSRLFTTSASTDQIAVVDTRAGRVIARLSDPPPSGVLEGSTPNALALSPDGTRLFVAEADANAVAVFDLSAGASGISSAHGNDRLAGRIPTEWYPTAVTLLGDSLWVVNGKGGGAGPNPRGAQPDTPLADGDSLYTLGQLNGTVTILPAKAAGRALDSLSARVARANGWDASPSRQAHYPPFQHVIYVIKENRTFDQVLSDLPRADGDTSLLFFPRNVSPNHHALAERFGIYDRFFVNAEVSAQGHPWSTAGYVTEYVEKTTPDIYRSRRPETAGEGEVDDPAMGFVWNQAIKKGLVLRIYGEYGEPIPSESGDPGPARYRSTRAALRSYTSDQYPSFDLGVSDQRRANVWVAEFQADVAAGRMPVLEIIHLPSDHTAGARAGYPTPKAYMADNDLALGRVVDALSHSPFWASTVMFVLEDDAQDGPDHVDSHRSVLLVISPYSRAGLVRRFVNTTDVLATIEEILGLGPLSQFDRFGRPLREIWAGSPDLRPFAALTPTHSLTEINPSRGAGARRSARLDFSAVDRVEDDEFNRILWRALKGSAPYPAVRRAGTLEYTRSR